jgi:hypothetical protein
VFVSSYSLVRLVAAAVVATAAVSTVPYTLRIHFHSFSYSNPARHSPLSRLIRSIHMQISV